MNEKKTLFRTPWRKVFLLFLQRRQGFDLSICNSTQWTASFRKRLENFSLNSMVQRIESKRLLYYYRIVLPTLIDRQNPLRSQAHRKDDSTLSSFSSFISHPYLAMIVRRFTLAIGYNVMTEGFLKGVKANRITNYPIVVFYKRSTFLQDGLKLATHTYLPAIIHRQEIFDRLQRYTLCIIPLRMQDKPRPVRQIFGQKGGSETTSQDSGRFIYSNKTLFIKQLYREVGIEEDNYEGRHMEGMEGVSLTPKRRMSMIIQDTIRSMKSYRSKRPYQGSALKSAYGDMQNQGSALKSVYGDKQYTKADTIITRNRTLSTERFNSNMDPIKGDWKREYFRGLENLNSPEAPGIIRSLNQDGLKRIHQKHLSDVTLRQERVDYTQADVSYAIPPRIQAKTKRSEAYLDSISTETHEYPKPVSLDVARMPFNEMTQRKNPLWGKKEMGDKGISIDYQKIADHVYEILTRRIIREKERMGELI